ncbi:MAG: hypothetical protein ACFCUR_04050 [Rhodomicrobiaceae bacterium]
MKLDDLSNLLCLRRQRERSAEQLVRARQHRLQHAEAELAAASDAVANHERQAQKQERETLADVIGRKLRAGEITNLQSGLNAEADRHRDLADLRRRAEGLHQERQTELETAQADFRKRYRQAEKLALLQTRLMTKAQRRALAIAEAVTDELHGLKATDERPAFSGDT